VLKRSRADGTYRVDHVLGGIYQPKRQHERHKETANKGELLGRHQSQRRGLLSRIQVVVVGMSNSVQVFWIGFLCSVVCSEGLIHVCRFVEVLLGREEEDVGEGEEEG
jgi:hypothetical protein